MAIAHVQTSGRILDNGASPAVVTISFSPTAGNFLIVTINQRGSGSTRTYTVSDNIDGTTGWETDASINANPDRQVRIYWKKNIPSGITTITITVNTGNLNFDGMISEFSGMGATPVFVMGDSYDDATVANNHTCSDTPLTSVGETLGYCLGQLDVAATELNPGTNWTEPNSLASARDIRQYQISSSGFSNEFGEFSNTGAAQASLGVIGLWYSTATPKAFPFRLEQPIFITKKRVIPTWVGCMQFPLLGLSQILAVIQTCFQFNQQPINQLD